MDFPMFVLSSLFVIGLISYTVEGQGCFPSNYWISCLMDTCGFGGSCPGDPEAICRMERLDQCKGCGQVWYRPDGTRAQCGSRQNFQLCPGGEQVVHCKVDSCRWPCSHPEFTNMPCRQSYCGRCSAEYLIGDRWLKCPRSTTAFAGEVLPIDSVVLKSSSKACMHIPCPLDVCDNHRCPEFPQADCIPDGCNRCRASWYIGNRPVNCYTGAVLPPIAMDPIDPLTDNQRVCSGGEPLMPCSDDVCLGQTCPNYKGAFCRPDGCGQCKATWYLENKLVDCYSSECPPNVMRYKCVVDPCIYFSHYCPAAECRASECGRCEAKFFLNNKEISCVQPPKQCQSGEHTMVCPWYTCPNTECPSDLNLMCRINPCGFSCTSEWIDVKSGQIGTCRTFQNMKDMQENKTQERVFMVDPLTNFHNNIHSFNEKPYIEVKENPDIFIEQVPKESPLFSVKHSTKMQKSLSIPIIEPTINNSDSTIRDNNMFAQFKPDVQAMVASIGDENFISQFKPINQVIHADTSLGDVSGSATNSHIQSVSSNRGSNTVMIPESVQVFKNNFQPIIGNHKNINLWKPEHSPLFHSDIGRFDVSREGLDMVVPKPIPASKPRTAADINGMVAEPMPVFIPTLQTLDANILSDNTITSNSVPLFKPDIALNPTEFMNKEPVQMFQQSLQLGDISERTLMAHAQVPIVGQDLQTISEMTPLHRSESKRRSQTSDIISDNIMMLGGDDPVLNGLILDLLRASKTKTLPSSVQNVNEALENPSVVPVAQKSVKQDSPFGFNHLQFPLKPDSVVDNSRHQLDKMVDLNSISNINNVIQKKTAGKPKKTGPLIKTEWNTFNNHQSVPEDNHSGVMTQTIRSTTHTIPLYPELELSKQINSMPVGFDVLESAHLHVPIRKDTSKPKPITNAKAPLMKQWVLHQHKTAA